MSREQREKYGAGVVGIDYIATGIPRNAGTPKEEPDYHSINDANTRYAIKHFRQWKAKRKGPEYKIIFE